MGAVAKRSDLVKDTNSGRVVVDQVFADAVRPAILKRKPWWVR